MLHFNILHYQFLWIFHDKIQSNMHNFTLFSREIEWNLKCFHFFREMKSETNIPFTLFEKWKVKWFFVSLFSRSESEIEIPRDRDREVKFQKKSREFSRNENLAGLCYAGVDKILLKSERGEFQPSPVWRSISHDIGDSVIVEILKILKSHIHPIWRNPLNMLHSCRMSV